MLICSAFSNYGALLECTEVNLDEVGSDCFWVVDTECFWVVIMSLYGCSLKIGIYCFGAGLSLCGWGSGIWLSFSLDK